MYNVHCTVAPQLCAGWLINIVLGIAHQHCALYCTSNIVHGISQLLCSALRINIVRCIAHQTLCTAFRINIVRGIAHQHLVRNCASTLCVALRINLVRGIAHQQLARNCVSTLYAALHTYFVLQYCIYNFDAAMHHTHSVSEFHTIKCEKIATHLPIVT